MKKLNIHFTGIKGVGMAPLAIIAKEAGFTVTGSDIEDKFITDQALRKAKITPFIGFSKEHIKNPDLVIITGAHGGYDNIEAREAKNKKIKVITQGEAAGLFMDGGFFSKKFIGISVAGTHGKTTTTAMLATILKENKLDPSFIIGTGDIVSLGSPGHLGEGKYFIAEADEYVTEPVHDKRPKFMWQLPKIAILTNIEFDHPDVYESIDDIRNSFLKFCNQLPKAGLLIACGDDEEVKKLLKEYKGNVVTYGFSSTNDYIMENVHISGEHMFFRVSSHGTSLSDFMLRVSGEHNALNALGAIIGSLETGLSIEKIKNGLLAFSGSKRRLEYIGELTTGAHVYDDYAHHPTEIKKTLHALKMQYPTKRITCIFEPHTYSRTKKLFEEFIDSFEDADEIIITDIFASLRESKDSSISSQMLVNRMKIKKNNVIYLSNNEDVVKYLSEKRFRSDSILVTMGAGAIYKVHAQLKFV